MWQTPAPVGTKMEPDHNYIIYRPFLADTNLHRFDSSRVLQVRQLMSLDSLQQGYRTVGTLSLVWNRIVLFEPMGRSMMMERRQHSASGASFVCLRRGSVSSRAVLLDGSCKSRSRFACVRKFLMVAVLKPPE